MLKRRSENHVSFRAPLVGFGIMLLAIACFLVLLWVLIIVVRVVAG